MKLKIFSISIIAALALLFSSCQKDNIDELNTSGDEPGTELISCDLETSLEENPAGTLNASVEGGTEPYNYLWSTGESTSSITVEESGTYAVVITDAEGCVNENSIDVTITNNTDCNDFETGFELDGEQAMIFTWGTGTAPYTLVWSNGDVLVGSDESFVHPFYSNELHSVLITDAAGCTSEISFMPCTALEATLEETSPGVLTATASGLNGDYYFQWSTGETFTGVQSSSTINVTADGTYSVEIGGPNGCQEYLSITVSGNGGGDCAGFGVEAGETSPGVLFADGFGGIAPYVYMWSTGETGNTITVNTPGIYTVTCTDSQGCAASWDIEVN